MRYVTSIPPIGETPETPQPEALHPINAVHPVRARVVPAHPAEFYARPTNATATQPPTENTEEKRAAIERRQFCRRTESSETLLETRSRVERRKKAGVGLTQPPPLMRRFRRFAVNRES